MQLGFLQNLLSQFLRFFHHIIFYFFIFHKHNTETNVYKLYCIIDKSYHKYTDRIFLRTTIYVFFLQHHYIFLSQGSLMWIIWSSISIHNCLISESSFFCSCSKKFLYCNAAINFSTVSFLQQGGHRDVSRICMFSAIIINTPLFFHPKKILLIDIFHFFCWGHKVFW